MFFFRILLTPSEFCIPYPTAVEVQNTDQDFPPHGWLCLNPTAQKDNREVLGASFRVEQFPEIVGGKINARAECGGIQRTHFYIKIRCVSDPVKLKDISLAHT